MMRTVQNDRGNIQVMCYVSRDLIFKNSIRFNAVHRFPQFNCHFI